MAPQPDIQYSALVKEDKVTVKAYLLMDSDEFNESSEAYRRNLRQLFNQYTESACSDVRMRSGRLPCHAVAVMKKGRLEALRVNTSSFNPETNEWDQVSDAMDTGNEIPNMHGRYSGPSMRS